MTMLSGPLRAPRPRRKALAAPPAFLRRGDDLAFSLAGEPVVALREGAMWIEAHAALVVSDLHFEKGTAFARSGQFLPPYDTRATLERLTALCDRLAPRQVVSLGDSFHDGRAFDRMDQADRAALAALVARQDWVWIAGNHDPETPPALAGRRMETLTLGALTLRHEPSPQDHPGEVAGHLHPCARILGEARSVRVRCFATDGDRLVMPAFGAYTGGLSLRDAAFAPLFPKGAAALAMGKDRLYPIGPERLA
jgi:hypothetical protein